jgi:signal peptidase II
VLVDQLTKIWAVARLEGGGSIEVLGQFFMLSLVYNEGGAMGTRLAPSMSYLIASILILCLVFYYAWTLRGKAALVFPLALIAGGAIGNIVDRIRLGRVIDFLDVDFFDINLWGFSLNRWWTFNVADAAISCSIVFLLFYLLTRPVASDPSKQAELATGDAPQPGSPQESSK